MSESKWTPGPWEMRVSPDETRDKGNLYYVGVGPYALLDRVYGTSGSREQLANATLIAAAPELYEALGLLYSETADYIAVNNLGDAHHNRSMQMARAALAKARGEKALTLEIRRWASNAIAHGGSFVKSFAEAVLRADPDNYEILEQATRTLMEKYPKILR